jgi:glutathione synthase/RimK-type ligase-like ATP-grasp enzyme
VLPYEASEEERNVAEMGLRTLGMKTQYARIDTVLTEEGPLIIEMELIEPRLFFENYPETAESYVDHIERFIKK